MSNEQPHPRGKMPSFSTDFWAHYLAGLAMGNQADGVYTVTPPAKHSQDTFTIVDANNKSYTVKVTA